MTWKFDRRSFVQKLGLGVGAGLLAPIAESLIREAHGQTMNRKRFVVLLQASGMVPEWNHCPKEFYKEVASGLGNFGRTADDPVMNGPKDYTWPAMVKALEKYRSRMLLIDGLGCEVGGQHTMGYGALTCVPAEGDDGERGGPQGISIDQYLAQSAAGKDAPFKSVLAGIQHYTAPLQTTVFANGPKQPAQEFGDPALMFKTLFGDFKPAGSPTPAPNSGPDKREIKRKIVLDAMRGDVGRLQRYLAGPEKQKLDQYLAAIEDFDKRKSSPPPVSISCTAPKEPMEKLLVGGNGDSGYRDSTPERFFNSMSDLALMAMACGLTNVVGLESGSGMSHVTCPVFPDLVKGTMFDNADNKDGLGTMGHDDQPKRGQAMDIIFNWHAATLARWVETLSGIKEGDKSIFDNTVMVMLSDNADDHHALHKRVPLVVIGDCGGALKSDGRYIRYPLKGQPGNRSLADFFCTIAHAMGAPTDTFGMGGPEKVQGPLSEIGA